MKHSIGSAVCGQIPILIISIQTANLISWGREDKPTFLVALGDHAYDNGDPFLTISATDLWAKVVDHKEDDPELCLFCDDRHVASLLITPDVAESIKKQKGVVVLLTPVEVDKDEAEREIQPPYQLEQIEEWVRSKETEHNLAVGQIDGFTLGAWDRKPF